MDAEPEKPMTMDEYVLKTYSLWLDFQLSQRCFDENWQMWASAGISPEQLNAMEAASNGR